MIVRVAKSAGFCYGVSRAVSLVEQAVEEGKTVVTLGPIAHNRHLVRSFEERGVRTVSTINEIPDGGRILLQKAVDVLPDDTPQTLQRRVMEQAEWILLPRAAAMAAQSIAEEREA